MSAAGPMDVEDERHCVRLADEMRAELRILETAGLGECDYARQLVEVRTGLMRRVRSSSAARSRQEQEKHEAAAARRQELERQQAAHEAAVLEAETWLRAQLQDGERPREDVLRAAGEAGLIRWLVDDSMPASVGGRWVRTAALNEALARLDVRELYGPRGERTWTMSWVVPWQLNEPARA